MSVMDYSANRIRSAERIQMTPNGIVPVDIPKPYDWDCDMPDRRDDPGAITCWLLAFALLAIGAAAWALR